MRIGNEKKTQFNCICMYMYGLKYNYMNVEIHKNEMFWKIN